MKKIWFGFAAFLLGSSLIYGFDTEFQYETVFDQSGQVAVSPESSPGLTPRRPQTTTLTQQVPVSMPVPIPMATHHSEPPRLTAPPVATVALRTEAPVVQHAPPATSCFDPHVYAELDRLNSAIQQLQRTAAPPDTRRGFSTPRVSGRMSFDTWMFSQPDRCADCPNIQNKAGLREFRLGVSGTGYEAFDYKIELIFPDSTGAPVQLTDMWIGAKNMPGLGYIRVGHFNLETGNGYMTGTTQTTGTSFLGPSPAFFIGRRLGISSEHLFAQDRIRWFGGFFQGQAINANRSYQADYQGYMLNTRLTAVPYFSAGGRNFLHFGGHYSFVDALSQSPGAHPGVAINAGGNGWGLGDPGQTLRTGTIQGRYQHRSGLELAYQRGPFGVMSEAFFARYGSADDHRTARGASLELSYFLTGDHRAYNLANGVVGAVQVNRPFVPFRSGGWNLVNGTGAWQIYTQYGYIDLTDWRGVTVLGTQPIGGYQHDLTLGVNWFWTSNLRWMFEYTHSQQNTGSNRKYCYQDILGASVRVYW